MAVASPCINVCKMDVRTGLCEGCLRTLDEIVAWAGADDVRKAGILSAVAGRRAGHDPCGAFPNPGGPPTEGGSGTCREER